jgi:hypothetical protein
LYWRIFCTRCLLWMWEWCFRFRVFCGMSAILIVNRNFAWRFDYESVQTTTSTTTALIAIWVIITVTVIHIITSLCLLHNESITHRITWSSTSWTLIWVGQIIIIIIIRFLGCSFIWWNTFLSMFFQKCFCKF